MASMYASAVLILGMNNSLFAWLLLRFMMGAVISGLYTIIESWLNERCDASNRGSVLSVYSMMNMLMIAFGQQLLNIAEEASAILFGLAAIFLCLAIVPVSLTLTLAPAPVKNVKLGLKKLWRHSHTALTGVIVAGLLTGAFWSLAPVFASSIGFDNAGIAWFMSATVIGGALFQYPLGRLSDRVDRRLVMIYMALAGAVVSILFWVFADLGMFHGWLSTLLAMLWGGFGTTLYPITLAHANDNVSPDDFVEIGSSMLIVLGVSSALSAPLASLSMQYYGPAGLYIYMAGCAILFSVVVILRRHKHELPVTEHVEGYQVIPNMTAPTLFGLDPRNEEPVADADAVNTKTQP